MFRPVPRLRDTMVEVKSYFKSEFSCSKMLFHIIEQELKNIAMIGGQTMMTRRNRFEIRCSMCCSEKEKMVEMKKELETLLTGEQIF